jgi:hypothetical protein
LVQMAIWRHAAAVEFHTVVGLAERLNLIRHGRLGQSQPHLFTVSGCRPAQTRIGRGWFEQRIDEGNLFGPGKVEGLVLLDDAVGIFLDAGDDEFTQGPPRDLSVVRAVSVCMTRLPLLQARTACCTKNPAAVRLMVSSTYRE